MFAGGRPKISTQHRMAATQASASTSAYVDPDLEIVGAKDGSLAGLTFAVKDMFDVSSLRPFLSS